MHEHEYEAMYRIEDFYWWYVARRSLIERIITDELGERADARLLDVGSGTGANLAAFTRHVRAVGVDMSTEALAFCKLRGVPSVARSRVEQLPFPDGTFDVVTALDVLEHTDDDLEVLAELRRICRPGGLVVITVPAYGFLWSEHDEALKHRRRYTRHELRNKLTLTDFSVQRASYFITALFFPILGLRIYQGIVKRSTHPQTSLRVLPGWMNRALVHLLGLEHLVFRHINLPFGVSLVALARPIEDGRGHEPPVTSRVRYTSRQTVSPRRRTT
jgi:SAM-dependent methyltransferase